MVTSLLTMINCFTLYSILTMNFHSSCSVFSVLSSVPNRAQPDENTIILDSSAAAFLYDSKTAHFYVKCRLDNKEV